MSIAINKTLNIHGRLIVLDQPKVMGVLNITPDSFYSGSRFNADSILAHVERILKEGADFIDVGGYSSRPGAEDIGLDEELNRVIPVIKAIVKIFPETIISIDTFRSEVAYQAVTEGASIVNDISAGLLDKNMLNVVAKAQVPYVMMHMKGNPQNMNSLAQYEDLTKDITDYFHKRIGAAHSNGIKDIIIDPGFGFAKTARHNFELLQRLDHFQIFEKPILVGLSRKSMIWKTLQVTPEEAMNGTTALNSIALWKGANIIRVHDVKEAVECCKLMRELL